MTIECGADGTVKVVAISSLTGAGLAVFADGKSVMTTSAANWNAPPLANHRSFLVFPSREDEMPSYARIGYAVDEFKIWNYAKTANGEFSLFLDDDNILGMVPRKVYDAVGEFDESYVQIFEESDFGWKIHEAGYEAIRLELKRCGQHSWRHICDF